MAPASPLAVVGAGAWGTALANAAAHAGREVLLFARDEAHVAALAATRTNARYLPGVRLAESVVPVASLGRLGEARAVLLVVPAQAMRAAASSLAHIIAPGTPAIICAKGIERGTGVFLSDALAAALPQAKAAVLSGPSFAADVARGLPTAVVLAAHEEEVSATLARELSGPTFRVYHGTDVRGVEIGGAAKNVLAIACGIVAGRRLGESARAALVARGFAELGRFARAYGARAETLMGLSGLGDLVLTCGSAQSRNFAFGQRLGEGATVREAGEGRLTEGVLTAPVLVAKARERGVEMPVAEAVEAVLEEKLTVEGAIEALMMRPIKAEA